MAKLQIRYSNFQKKLKNFHNLHKMAVFRPISALFQEKNLLDIQFYDQLNS